MTQESPAAPLTPSDDGARRAPRWRRWTAGALIVLSCVLVPLSVLGVWVRNQVLNTDRYVENVTPLASNPAVISTVAADVTTRLFTRIDVEQAAKDALPPRAEFLAAPLATGLRDVVERAAVQILSTEEFQQLWVRANEIAHAQLRKALTDEGKVVTTADGKVVLDLSAIVERVRLSLKERGIGVFDRIPIDNLALRFEVADVDQLASAQQATRLLNTLSWALPVLSLVCLGLGLWLSGNRRRTLLRWGIGTAFAVALVGAGVAVGRGVYLDAVTSPQLPEATAAAVFDTLVRFLRYGVRVFIAVGLVVAFGAWVSGPSRAASRLRTTAMSLVGGAGDAAEIKGVTFGAFGVWVARHRAPLRVAAGLVVLVALLLWNHPRGGTVLLLAVVFLVLLALIEFVARASTFEVAGEAGAHSTIGASQA